MKKLSGGVLDKLWEGGGFVLARTTLPDGPAPVLVLAPASERPAAGVIARLEHAFALREELDPSGFARPLRLVQYRGLPALLLEDPGGNLLASLLGQPWDLPRFLRVAIEIAVALSRLHARGLIHCSAGERKNPVVRSSRSGFRARGTTHFATAFRSSLGARLSGLGLIRPNVSYKHIDELLTAHVDWDLILVGLGQYMSRTIPQVYPGHRLT
jgi:hypothetical protein